MSPLDIIRAWKDETFRMSLSQADRAALPEHPAGMIELSDVELDDVAGGVSKPGTTKSQIKPKVKNSADHSGCGTGTGTGGNCTKCNGCKLTFTVFGKCWFNQPPVNKA